MSSSKKDKIKKRNKTARNQTNKLNLYSNLSVYNDNTNNTSSSMIIQDKIFSNTIDSKIYERIKKDDI